MQRTLRTILATFIAFVGSIVLSYFFENSSRSDVGFGQFLILGLVYGLPILCLGITMFFIINYLTQLRIRRNRFKNIHLFYFGLSIAFGLIPVLAFSAFDFADRGRFFREPTFGEILIKYMPALWLTSIGAVTNWLLVWRPFVNRF